MKEETRASKESFFQDDVVLNCTYIPTGRETNIDTQWEGFFLLKMERRGDDKYITYVGDWGIW